jgi:hypothetical protein
MTRSTAAVDIRSRIAGKTAAIRSRPFSRMAAHVSSDQQKYDRRAQFALLPGRRRVMNENDNLPPNGPGEPERPNPYARQAQAAADRARSAAQDALGVSRRLLGNPVAGIGEAHSGLGADRVLGVSIVFALIAAVGLALAGGLLMRAVLGGMMGSYGAGFGFNFGTFLKSTLIYLVTIIAAGGGILMLARPFGGSIATPSALFVAATAFLPLGLASLLAAIIAGLLSNRLGMIIASLLMLYGACYLVLILNAGLRRVAGVDERRAALATPSVLAIATFVSSLVSWLFSR